METFNIISTIIEQVAFLYRNKRPWNKFCFIGLWHNKTSSCYIATHCIEWFTSLYYTYSIRFVIKDINNNKTKNNLTSDSEMG